MNSAYVLKLLLRCLELIGREQATSISQLVRLPGIVISASVLASRAIKLHITCKSCRHVAHMDIQGGFAGFSLPRRCGS